MRMHSWWAHPLFVFLPLSYLSPCYPLPSPLLRENKKIPRKHPFARDFMYPDPGSNRDGLPHWCLRPARLPIPPSGLQKRVQGQCKPNAEELVLMLRCSLFSQIVCKGTNKWAKNKIKLDFFLFFRTKVPSRRSLRGTNIWANNKINRKIFLKRCIFLV